MIWSLEETFLILPSSLFKMETLKSSLNPETHFGGEEFDKSKVNHLVAKFKLKNPKNSFRRLKNPKNSFRRLALPLGTPWMSYLLNVL